MRKNKDYPKILHWDGKIMEVTNQTGKVVQDMNSVVLTVPGVGVK